MTFTQLTARLINFLRGWLLVLSLKEGLVECATVCIKSVVILANIVTDCQQKKTGKLHISLDDALSGSGLRAITILWSVKFDATILLHKT